MFDYILGNQKIDFYGNSAAIVSNSGILLENEYGSEIDKHDYVIRCNGAPTKSYEKHVGIKTDLHVLSCLFLYCIYDDDYYKKIKSFYKVLDRNYILNLRNTNILLILNRPLRQEDMVLISDIKKYNNIAITWYTSPAIHLETRVFEPTCGFMAILTAISFFKDVSIFCFSMYKQEIKKWCYFLELDNNCGNNDCHSLELERRYIDKLLIENKIKEYS